ncbi:MAG: helix-turn-helix transcriptional regulator [Defluviitaleaceae bacterium]|nr:helix-turn-helix transcriptional regulator [Defluviitaleaceae bacterium]MCL2274663.1 helix-turn-helix transcriptional regulator [Defluviitaleaceae bacterium]MCL2275776.1 helix-turn-helix transcriptional regulator [Defluviitaleaceae bacterium]
MSEKSEHSALTEGVYLILISLQVPRHGYAVMQNIEGLTAGRVILGAGTLYGAINSLLDKGWISAIGHDSTSRKKEYVITPMGKTVLHNEIKRLEALVKIGQEERLGVGNEN